MFNSQTNICLLHEVSASFNGDDFFKEKTGSALVTMRLTCIYVKSGSLDPVWISSSRANGSTIHDTPTQSDRFCGLCEARGWEISSARDTRASAHEMEKISDRINCVGTLGATFGPRVVIGARPPNVTARNQWKGIVNSMALFFSGRGVGGWGQVA